MEKKEHIPVLITEITNHLDLERNPSKIVDATLGLGGYSKYILESGYKGKILGIDADKNNLAIAKENLTKWKGQCTFALDNFRNISTILEENNFQDADAFLFDLGLCSTQIDNAERGFSFQKEGPLDMRFGNEGNTAYDIINFTPETLLAEIIYTYGEERLSRHIAKKIVEARKKKKIETTLELSDLIKDVYEYKGFRNSKRNPATKTFQALRMKVNEELSSLEQALNSVIETMKKDAKILVVTYHSIEDRLVKEIFKEAKKEKKIQWINKHVIVPPSEEQKENPRSRSAKLRIIKKIET